MKSVAVVGGGIGGLTALYELSKDRGIQADLYEASERVGGRIKTVHAGRPVDMGAGYFHL